MAILGCFEGNAAIITLNRPEKLNATNLETIQQISLFLQKCAANDAVQKIIITSDHPKAFCAGGDISAVYHAMHEQKRDEVIKFFELEYDLINTLANFSKPIISLVNGLCFGGGMGLTMHNKIRIVTEKAILGMPETIIGFFPDVGASYRFAQFPRPWANFYALTASPIPIHHALKWSMADYFVPSDSLAALQDALCSDIKTEDAVKEFSKPLKSEALFDKDLTQGWVSEVFSKNLKDIFLSLNNNQKPEAQKILNDLNSKSPLSLWITHKLMEKSVFFDLKKSLEVDKILALNFLKRSDFLEGIRAQVIDKDKSPKWKITMDIIDDSIVENFFVSS